MRAVCLALCVMLVLAALMGCGSKTGIVGTWKDNTSNVTYEFTSDNKVSITFSGTYTLDKDTNALVLSIGSQKQTVSIGVSGNTMSVTDPSTGSVVTLTRVK